MNTKLILFSAALLCAAHGQPLGTNTVCETSPNYGLGGILGGQTLGGYGLNPYTGVGVTTVCDNTPNILGMGYNSRSLGLYNGLGSTVCETPNMLALHGMGRGYPFTNLGGGLGVGSTTVCESGPNGYVGMPYVRAGIGGLNLLGGINPLSSTVCETTPNVGLGLGLGMGRHFF